VRFLPRDVSVTQCHETIILFVDIEILNKALAKKVVKTPEQVQKTTMFKTRGFPSTGEFPHEEFKNFRGWKVGPYTVKMWLKIALNAVRLPKFEPVNGIS